MRMFWKVRPMPLRVSVYGASPPTDSPLNLMAPDVG